MSRLHPTCLHDVTSVHLTPMYILFVPHFITQKLGWTPLMSAAAFGKYDVVSELIFLGANVNIQTIVSPYWRAKQTI